MVDQNQTGSQVNGQPAMGGNPYDLIDNRGQVNLESSVPNIDVKPVEQVQQSVAQNVNTQTNNVEVSQKSEVVSATPAQADAYKGPSGFTKKLIGFIAKLSGQPDPETGVGAQKPVVTNVKDPQAPVNAGETVTNTNAFDSIMGGVTGFLDKVEKKVEHVSGLDLDAPINKPIQNVQNNVPQQEVQQPTVSATEPVQVVEQPQQIVTEPVAEQKIESVPVQIVEPVAQEKVEEEKPVEEETSAESNTNNPSPDFGSIPTMDQSKPA